MLALEGTGKKSMYLGSSGEKRQNEKPDVCAVEAGTGYFGGRECYSEKYSKGSHSHQSMPLW